MLERWLEISLLQKVKETENLSRVEGRLQIHFPELPLLKTLSFGFLSSSNLTLLLGTSHFTFVMFGFW